jgi:hypothetical protein
MNVERMIIEGEIECKGIEWFADSINKVVQWLGIYHGMGLLYVCSYCVVLWCETQCVGAMIVIWTSFFHFRLVDALQILPELQGHLRPEQVPELVLGDARWH